jgi:hypothetical protein
MVEATVYALSLENPIIDFNKSFFSRISFTSLNIVYESNAINSVISKNDSVFFKAIWSK